MHPEDEWGLIRGDRASRIGGFGMGAIRVALLFGSAAIALALIIAPIAERQTRSNTAGSGLSNGLDTISTGSIAKTRNYTIRQSVLQATPNSICVIQENGTRIGDC